VVRRARLDRGVRRDRARRIGRREQPLADGRARPDHRDVGAARDRRAQRAVQDGLTAGLALVGDDDADRAGVHRVLGLDAERARAALHQRDRAAREAGEVRLLAARRARARRVGVERRPV
ncbi:MAG: hypothetical protein AVDCRST_MAG79-36, partial [uncultured Thermoleophilia bacterium]